VECWNSFCYYGHIDEGVKRQAGHQRHCRTSTLVTWPVSCICAGVFAAASCLGSVEADACYVGGLVF